MNGRFEELLKQNNYENTHDLYRSGMVVLRIRSNCEFNPISKVTDIDIAEVDGLETLRR